MTKLLPYLEVLLEEWFPGERIEPGIDYVYVGTKESGLKVSRTTGKFFMAHHAAYNKPKGDLLNMFQHLFEIDDPAKAWAKLDAIRIRIEREDPKIHAEKARKRAKAIRATEEKFLGDLKCVIWDFLKESGRMSPPPTNPTKRAKKTARAFWEWMFQFDAEVTASQVQNAFAYWEKTGHDLYFRVSKAQYSKMTNWTLTETGVS